MHDDAGKNRATACAPQLQELNSSVSLTFNPKPETQNPKPETRNPKPRARAFSLMRALSPLTRKR